MKYPFATAVGATVFVLSKAWAVPLTANEVLYLADTGEIHDGASNLYRVDWQDGVQGAKEAVLKLLPAGRLSLNHVDAMAASRDGRKLWVIDDGAVSTHQLSYYDLSSDTVYLIDFIHGIPDLSGNSIDAAAVAPDEQLYVARSDASDLWTIDTATAEATLVGVITDRKTRALIDMQGGDLVFNDDGVLYLWANNNRTGAPRGLYAVAYRNPVSGVVYATHLGEDNASFRGLALGSEGRIVGSDSESDQILLLDPATGTVEDYRSIFRSTLESEPSAEIQFNHTLGDMTAAPALRCAKTIGYWKNHHWDGATVVLNGEEIDQDRGHQILWDARGKNFSMLFAQVIAAKLNCPDCGRRGAMDAAERFLLSHGVTADNYDEHFENRRQKWRGAKYAEKLDGFNTQYACDEVE